MNRAGVTATLVALALVGCGEGSSSAAEWPYHEGFRPAGQADGTVLYYHGGNWKSGRDLVAATRPAMRKFTRSGWRAVSVDYSSERPLRDAARWYVRLNERRGPLCVAGDSAGAQIALMVAVDLDPDCVIAEGAPVDLTGKTPLHEAVLRGASAAYGERRRSVSPLYHAREIDAPVILSHYREDRIVPLKQARAMRDALPAVRLRVLDGPGPGRFVHAWQGVRREDLQNYEALVKRRLQRLG